MRSAFTGKIALVTGANRGIGFEVCRELAGQGHRVVLTSRDEAQGQQAAQRLRGEGGDVLYHQLEVTDRESIDRLRGWVEHELGRIEILVNNAGVYPTQGSILDIGLDVVRDTLEINTYGPLLMCQAFVPLMRRHGWGRVVNVSSGAGQLHDMTDFTPAYNLSKTALNAVTRMVADAVGGSNILVNSVCPGWVRTAMGGRSAPRSVEQGADTIVWLATLPDGGPSGGFFRDRKPIPW
jgi:NAD(P)-dependent dehydrogenase (short-subunit alcohol dehydrogenase family)